MPAAALTLRRSLVFVALLHHGSCLLRDAASYETTEDQLFTELFETRHYRLSRPARHVADVVNVKLQLVLKKVVKLHELEEVLKTDIWYKISWNDYRLSWNASEYDGLDAIFIPASKLWIPDILHLTNAKDNNGRIGKTNDLNTELVQVMPNGDCTWFSPSLLMSYCSVDVSMFPFDKQNCSIAYELWGHDAGHVQLSALSDKIDLEQYQENGEWNLIGTELVTTSVNYSGGQFPYKRLTYMIHLRRKSLYYVFNFIVPCCTFSIVSLATFLLQSDSGERIGLSVSLLLGFSVYQAIINEQLPETSDGLPLLGIYFMFVMLKVALSVLMSVVVISLCHSTTVVMPSWIKRLVNHRLANALGIRNSSNARSVRKVCDGSPMADFQNDEVKGDDRCSRRSTIVNVVDGSNCSTTADSQVKHITSLLPTENADPEVGDLEEETVTGDWMLVARVIDRMCFIVFSLGLFAGTLACCSWQRSAVNYETRVLVISTCDQKEVE